MRVWVAIFIAVFFFVSSIFSAAFGLGGTTRQSLYPNPNFAVSFVSSNTPEKSGGATTSFTRATASTAYNTSGVVTTISSGNPTIGAALTSNVSYGTLDSTAPATGIYIGEAVTFSALNNEVLTAANWPDYVGTPTRSQDAVAAPDGNTTADQITDDDAGNPEAIEQSVAIAADTATWTASVWVRCDSAHNTMLALAVGAGATTTVSCSTTWQKMAVSVANNGADTAAEVRLYPMSDAGTGTAEFWRPELYQFSKAVPLDPATTSSTVTVNADNMDFTGAPVGDMTIGTICAWVNFPPASATAASGADDAGIVEICDAADCFTLGVRVLSNALADFQTIWNKGMADGATNSTGQAYSANIWNHVCYSWQEIAGADNSHSFVVNGVLSSIDPVGDASWTDGSFSGSMDIQIGGTSTGNLGSDVLPEGFIGGVKFWRRRLNTNAMIREYRRGSSTYAINLPPTRRERYLAQLGPLAPLVESILPPE